MGIPHVLSQCLICIKGISQKSLKKCFHYCWFTHFKQTEKQPTSFPFAFGYTSAIPVNNQAIMMNRRLRQI